MFKLLLLVQSLYIDHGIDSELHVAGYYSTLAACQEAKEQLPMTTVERAVVENYTLFEGRRHLRVRTSWKSACVKVENRDE